MASTVSTTTETLCIRMHHALRKQELRDNALHNIIDVLEISKTTYCKVFLRNALSRGQNVELADHVFRFKAKQQRILLLAILAYRR
jgi:hypothetical protein